MTFFLLVIGNTIFNLPLSVPDGKLGPGSAFWELRGIVNIEEVRNIILGWLNEIEDSNTRNGITFNVTKCQVLLQYLATNKNFFLGSHQLGVLGYYEPSTFTFFVDTLLCPQKKQMQS